MLFVLAPFERYWPWLCRMVLCSQLCLTHPAWALDSSVLTVEPYSTLSACFVHIARMRPSRINSSAESFASRARSSSLSNSFKQTDIVRAYHQAVMQRPNRHPNLTGQLNSAALFAIILLILFIFLYASLNKPPTNTTPANTPREASGK
jgi:hypothetical protein